MMRGRRARVSYSSGNAGCEGTIDWSWFWLIEAAWLSNRSALEPLPVTESAARPPAFCGDAVRARSRSFAR